MRRQGRLARSQGMLLHIARHACLYLAWPAAMAGINHQHAPAIFCRRVEEPVAAHLEKEGLQFIQFAFRWVNCLLLREVPFALAVRLWDTYLSEGCAIVQFALCHSSAQRFSCWAALCRCAKVGCLTKGALLLQSTPAPPTCPFAARSSKTSWRTRSQPSCSGECHSTHQRALLCAQGCCRLAYRPPCLAHSYSA